MPNVYYAVDNFQGDVLDDQYTPGEDVGYFEWARRVTLSDIKGLSCIYPKFCWSCGLLGGTRPRKRDMKKQRGSDVTWVCEVCMGRLESGELSFDECLPRTLGGGRGGVLH